MQRVLRVQILLASTSLDRCVGISALSEATKSSAMYPNYTVTKDLIENQPGAERELGPPNKKVQLSLGKEEWMYRNGYDWRGGSC